MNQIQRSDNIIYGEGLEPAAYHEGAFLHPADIGPLPSGEDGLELVSSENPYQSQYPQVLFGKEEKEVYHTNINPSEMDGVLPGNSNSRRRSKNQWWWMGAIITVITIAGVTVGIAEGLRHKRSQR